MHSNEGLQQGDPIGPVLFSNAIHPMLLSLESKLTIGYLDVLTVAGKLSEVSRDVCHIREVGHSMGLVLNVGKCEVIAHPSLSFDDSLLSSFKNVSLEDATLLGAPLSQGQALDLE